jgi:hypothetical protein
VHQHCQGHDNCNALPNHNHGLGKTSQTVGDECRMQGRQHGRSGWFWDSESRGFVCSNERSQHTAQHGKYTYQDGCAVIPYKHGSRRYPGLLPSLTIHFGSWSPTSVVTPVGFRPFAVTKISQPVAWQIPLAHDTFAREARWRCELNRRTPFTAVVHNIAFSFHEDRATRHPRTTGRATSSFCWTQRALTFPNANE